jgi:phosphate transport system substrate-binding protein
MNAWKKTLAVLALASFGTGPVLAKGPNQIVVDGSTTVGPIAKAFAEYYMERHPQVSITVGESGSGNGAKSLINATCDAATMSRPMKNSETKAAQDAGVLPIEHVVAMDGIAIIVHPGNPLSNLTLGQIRGIYAGQTRSWKELGGPDMPIVVISRDTNSGTYEAFGAMVMQGEKIADRAEYVGSNGAIRERVMSTPTAIGYVGMAFMEGVKVLTVEGIEVNPETVLARTYPISRPLFMYTNGRPKAGSPLDEFIGLCATAEGKKIISDLGFVPLK